MNAETVVKFRPDLFAIAPERIKRLPVDPDRGYPVPWFVAWVDGKPEFRVADARKYARAVREKLCWVCGERLGRHVAFVIGPMCAINRVSAEPGSHRDCAEFSARACPFLSKPAMTRREDHLPAEVKRDSYFGGVGLAHNPGGTLLYLPMDFARIPDGRGGHLFKLGEPLAVEWYTLGRRATRAEAAELLHTGALRLRKLAAESGPVALKEFERLHKRALDLLPES